jgi:ADP-heptose:LPS heptosyltransferase
MKKIIALRFSAMGDVSLTVPVIKGVLEANPDLHIILVTREFFAPFFQNIPRLDLVFPQFNKRHKGFLGIFRLYADLQKNGPYEAVIDLHGVLRTRIISFLFKRAGVPQFAINKGRKEKKFLIKSRYIRMLKHTTARYLETFNAAGFSGSIGKAPFLTTQEQEVTHSHKFLELHGISPDKLRIGIAPFATHQPKMWGVANFKELITLINNEFEVHFFLFGGGTQEISQLKELNKFSANIHLAAGEMNLTQELALMSTLDLMISMDSSNMHLASLSGVPTVSIWGGTHPAFGFSALGQPTEYSLQTPASSLKCRPCSVFGNKPCIYPTPRCMEMVKPEDVFNKLKKFALLNRKQKKTS